MAQKPAEMPVSSEVGDWTHFWERFLQERRVHEAVGSTMFSSERGFPMTFGRLAFAIIATVAIGARTLPAQNLALWEVPVGFPNGTGNIPTGNTYVMPNISTAGTTAGQQWPALPAAAYPNGTPTFGTLAGNSAAILSTFHSVAAALYTSPTGNGSQYSFSSNNWSPGDYYQVALPTTGVSNLQVSWDQARSSTGPAAFTLEMSTDGTTFTQLTSYTVLQSGGGGAPGTWSSTISNPLYTNTFALPETANNQASLYLRFTNNEAAVSSSSGSNRIDNIAVNVVPEPSTVTVAAMGLAVGGMLLRWRKAT
jgi:hypothetical protein